MIEMMNLASPRPAASSVVRMGNASSVVTTLERARLALQHAHTLQDVKDVHDVAKAATVYAREQKLGREVVHLAKAVTFEALRRLGDFLLGTDRAAGGRPYQSGGTGTQRQPVATLAKLGIDKNTSSWAQQLALLPVDDFERVRDGRATLRRMLADRKRAAELQEGLRYCREMRIDLHAYDLRLCGHRELFASGIRPDAVITAPPSGADDLELFSELGAACQLTRVSFVALEVSSRYMPAILNRLGPHLPLDEDGTQTCRYRGTIGTGNAAWLGGSVILLFADDAAVKRAREARGGPWTDSPRGDLLHRFTTPGQLVCDPFLDPTLAVTALQCKRRYVGAHPDAMVVERARLKIETEWAAWHYCQRPVSQPSSACDSHRA